MLSSPAAFHALFPYLAGLLGASDGDRDQLLARLESDFVGQKGLKKNEEMGPLYRALKDYILFLLQLGETQQQQQSSKLLAILVIRRLYPNCDKTFYRQFVFYLQNTVIFDSGSSSSLLVDPAVDLFVRLVKEDDKNSDVIRTLLEKAFELLSPGSASVETSLKVLKQCCVSFPTFVHPVLGAYLQQVPWLISDPRISIRVLSSEILGCCLDLLLSRGRVDPVLDVLHSDLESNLQSPNPNEVHGRLLILQEVLKRRIPHLSAGFLEVLPRVFALRSNDLNVTKATIELIPWMIEYNEMVFQESLLGLSCDFLLRKCRTDPKSYDSLCSIVKSCWQLPRFSSVLGPWISNMLIILGDSSMYRLLLPLRRVPFHSAIVRCFQTVYMYLSSDFQNYLPNVVNTILNLDFSADQISLLSLLFQKNPDLLDIPLCFINKIASCFSQTNFYEYSREWILVPRTRMFSMVYSRPSEDPRVLGAALRALSTFEFPFFVLLYVKEVVMPIVYSKSESIGLEASRSAIQLIKRFVETKKSFSLGEKDIIYSLIMSILQIGIDPRDAIRNDILSLFTEELDPFLFHPEIIQVFLYSLNDELYAIRVSILSILRRLTRYDPFAVLPTLRLYIFQIIGKFSTLSQVRNCDRNCDTLIRLSDVFDAYLPPYHTLIFTTLLKKVQTCTDYRVSLTILSVLYHIVMHQAVSEEYITQTYKAVFDLFVQIEDQLPQELLTMLLGLVKLNGHAILPYFDYPKLYPLLFNLLQSDQYAYYSQAVNLIGFLGIVDDTDYAFLLQLSESQSSTSSSSESLPVLHEQMSDDQVSLKVIFDTLLAHLDPRDAHIRDSVDTLFSILRTMNSVQSQQYIQRFLPAILSLFSKVDADIRKFFYSGLTSIMGMIRSTNVQFLPRLFECILDYWEAEHMSMLVLLDALCENCLEMFQSNFRLLTSSFLESLEKADRSDQQRLLKSLCAYSPHILEDINIYLPYLLELVQRAADPGLVPLILGIMDNFIESPSIIGYTSSIVHTLVRVLGQYDSSVDHRVLDTLHSLLHRAGSSTVLFRNLIESRMRGLGLHHANLEEVVVVARNRYPQYFSSPKAQVLSLRHGSVTVESTSSAVLQKRKKLDVQPMQVYWNNSRLVDPTEWTEWFISFALSFIQYSPLSAIQCCNALAQSCHSVLSDLFSIAFVSCWSEMSLSQQDLLGPTLQRMLSSESVPTDISKAVLSLMDFMERSEKRLPCSYQMLATFCKEHHYFSKSLFYFEQCAADPFISPYQRSQYLKEVLNTANHLSHVDYVTGLLSNYDAGGLNLIQNKGRYLEMLRQYKSAYDYYESSALDTMESRKLGSIRCLARLGQFQEVADRTKSFLRSTTDSSQELKDTVADFVFRSAFCTGDFELIQLLLEVTTDDPQSMLFRALLYTKQNDFERALSTAEQYRIQLRERIRVLLDEDYSYAFPELINTIHLSELEEVIRYKQLCAAEPERAQLHKEKMVRVWSEKYQKLPKFVHIRHMTLLIRQMAISSEESREQWIDLASLCRKTSRFDFCLSCLSMLGLNSSSIEANEPNVAYEYCKFLWDKGDRETSISKLRLMLQAQAGSRNKKLLILMLHKLSQYLLDMNPESPPVDEIIQHYMKSLALRENDGLTWHKLADANILWMERRPRSGRDPISDVQRIGDIIHALFSSVHYQVNPSIQLQDTLRLINYLFKFGSNTAIAVSFSTKMSTIPVDQWSLVIPQLLARVDTKSVNIRNLLHDILYWIGKSRPATLIYPLRTCSCSEDQERIKFAETLLEELSQQSPVLISQLRAVCSELEVIAVSWTEMWIETLTTAWQLSRQKNNEMAVETILKFAPGAGRIRGDAERALYASVKETIEEGLALLENGLEDTTRSGWEVLGKVYKALLDANGKQSTLSLASLFPQLANLEGSILPLPLDYSESMEYIERVSSKRRPKHIVVRDNTGQLNGFLLKGHEDLRQDERVMQVFGLVNKLLLNNNDTMSSDYTIRRYSITPITPQVGVIEWVDNSDTMFDLISVYREKHHVCGTLERKILGEVSLDRFELLPILGKLDCLEHCLVNTDGRDLKNAFLLNSLSCENWLKKRTTYTRSLAVMSMVGYLIGLGDRHPSNLMIDRSTGKICHIDFGDCFEVTIHRDFLPEKVPFRLTRMLIEAMEVSGVHGTFQHTCERIMRVLRHPMNHNSLFVMLEAFIHDPLVNWRLLNPKMVSASPASPQQMFNAVFDSDSQGGRPQPLSRSSLASYGSLSRSITRELLGSDVPKEELDRQAVNAIEKIHHKLLGTDFGGPRLSVETQVLLLIAEATSRENLCQSWLGW